MYYNRKTLEAWLEKVQRMNEKEICTLLDHNPPRYTTSKGKRLEWETLSAVKKLFTNIHGPVSATTIGGLLAGMFTIKQSRASGDMRVIAGKMLQANPKFMESIENLTLPDFIDEYSGKFADAIIDEYGDDSSARVIYNTFMFQDISMMEAMYLLHHRTDFGLEKSTRYNDYSKKINGKYQYVVDPLIKEGGLDKQFQLSTDGVFDIYADLMDNQSGHHKRLWRWLENELPFDLYEKKVQESLLKSQHSLASKEEINTGYNRTLSAAFKDQIRHLLPLSAKTQISLVMNAESLRHILNQHQARLSTEDILTCELLRREADKVFGNLAKICEPDNPKAKANRDFLWDARKPLPDYKANLFTWITTSSAPDNQLDLNIEFCQSQYAKIKDNKLGLEVYMSMDGGLNEIITGILMEKISSMTLPHADHEVKNMSLFEKQKMFFDYCGIGYEVKDQKLTPNGNDLRTNRRHRPGRALEASRIVLSMLMPIAEIRDLRRHTLQSYFDPQYFNPEHGAYISPGLKAIGLEKNIEKSYEKCYETWEAVNEKCGPFISSTALPMAVKAPMNTIVNLRNLYHIDELRTQPGAAPVYLRLCQMNYAALKHFIPEAAHAMKFVNTETEIDYGRSIQEARSIHKRSRNKVKIKLA